ncbi:DUF6359 domain-containing protein [Prevotellamassilia timonensis]|uniref:DUF6359 domain-containing protein n=1 Tax=Prevotellamassilia timonensis TaxID=1852370 RepID=UPI0023F0FB3A|nr:DUF6359 domain-containing protein [Prevotellamassilia timonensis]MDD7440284.1 DUF6359 domain-containing protein [Prevotellamassilia timonensis]
MKKLFALSVVMVALMLCGCNEIELPSEGSGGKEDNDKENVTAPDSDGTFTIATLSRADDGEFIALKGYIVGYMPTNTINKVVFNADDAVSTNIVLADRAAETDTKLCAGLQLKAGSDARVDLNLADNPAMLGQRIIAYGYKGTYCNAPGLKQVEVYELVDDDDDSGDGADSKGDGGESFPTLVTEGTAQPFEGC